MEGLGDVGTRDPTWSRSLSTLLPSLELGVVDAEHICQG